MAGTITIPLMTLQIGTTEFGPASVADTDINAVLSIDRTVVGGFNSMTALTTCQIGVYQSNDNGDTWFFLAGAGFPGGIYTNRNGQINMSGMGVDFWPGTGRLTRAETIIDGTAVAIQGSLVFS